jgi:hypothetical protein
MKFIQIALVYSMALIISARMIHRSADHLPAKQLAIKQARRAGPRINRLQINKKSKSAVGQTRIRQMKSKNIRKLVGETSKIIDLTQIAGMSQLLEKEANKTLDIEKKVDSIIAIDPSIEQKINQYFETIINKNMESISTVAQNYFISNDIANSDLTEIVEMIAKNPPTSDISTEIGTFLTNVNSSYESFINELLSEEDKRLKDKRNAMNLILNVQPEAPSKSLFDRAEDVARAVGQTVGVVPGKIGADFSDPMDHPLIGVGSASLGLGLYDYFNRKQDFTTATQTFKQQTLEYQIKIDSLHNENEGFMMIINSLKKAASQVSRSKNLLMQEIKQYDIEDLFPNL